MNLQTVEAPYIQADVAFVGPGTGLTGSAPGLTTGDLSTILGELSSTDSASLGQGMIGFNPALSYPLGTLPGDLASPLYGDALMGVESGLLGAVPRTQHQKNADSLNPCDFGAVGDGVTDNYPALQAFFANMVSGTLGTCKRVLFPYGRYYISQPVTIPGFTGVSMNLDQRSSDGSDWEIDFGRSSVLIGGLVGFNLTAGVYPASRNGLVIRGGTFCPSGTNTVVSVFSMTGSTYWSTIFERLSANKLSGAILSLISYYNDSASYQAGVMSLRDIQAINVVNILSCTAAAAAISAGTNVIDNLQLDNIYHEQQAQASPITLTGTIAGTVLTLTATAPAGFALGMSLSGTSVTANTYCLNLAGGTFGAPGSTYNLNVSSTVSAAESISAVMACSIVNLAGFNLYAPKVGKLVIAGPGSFLYGYGSTVTDGLFVGPLYAEPSLTAAQNLLVAGFEYCDFSEGKVVANSSTQTVRWIVGDCRFTRIHNMHLEASNLSGAHPYALGSYPMFYLTDGRGNIYSGYTSVEFPNAFNVSTPNKYGTALGVSDEICIADFIAPNYSGITTATTTTLATLPGTVASIVTPLTSVILDVEFHGYGSNAASKTLKHNLVIGANTIQIGGTLTVGAGGYISRARVILAPASATTFSVQVMAGESINQAGALTLSDSSLVNLNSTVVCNATDAVSLQAVTSAMGGGSIYPVAATITRLGRGIALQVNP